MKIRMNKRVKLARAAVSGVLALLFAGSGVFTMAMALGASVSAAAVYTAAGLAAALCVLGSLSTAGAAVSAALLLVLFIAFAPGRLSAVGDLLRSWGGAEVDPARLALGGRALAVGAAFMLGAAFHALLSRREFVPMAIALLLAMLVGSHAMSATASIGAAVPGMIAAAAAFALTGGVQRNGAALRALLPAALAVALALLIAPTGRVTWKPMADAAERVRAVFEQYFNFTRERVAFSLGEQGYDHAGEIDGEVVAMLGGPAQPHTQPVMAVRADGEALLRGTIRATYTGYSWIDTAAKNRYLYFDLTHRGVFNRVFDRDMESPGDAFVSRDVDVEMLDEGTSTLFVPARVKDFSMDLSTAVYYNTAGEMFLSREVRPGDRYSLRAMVPVPGEGLRTAAIIGEEGGDARYADILAAHSALPAGIDERVYALTLQATQGAETAYDRAEAIADYLRKNMRYTLEPEYPPMGRDFVSHFLLESREGYCSYYATAMAVMGRIAGLPTRYVEGYLARPGEDGAAVLTGADAHAWAEVYFKGVGWVPFDATSGATGRDPSNGGEQGGSAPDESEPDATDAPEGGSENPAGDPTPTPEPDDGAGQDEPTPTPEPDGGAMSEEPTPLPEPQPQPDDPNDTREMPEPQADGKPRAESHLALWLALSALLLALVALAVLWVRGRLRRADPVRLCNQAKTAKEAAMILYRSNLTLLAHMGQGPMNAESPEAFADRMNRQFGNGDYDAFVRAVAGAAYGRKPLRREDVECGLRAYEGFREAMGLREKLRFTLTRVFRGLGDFEVIP